MRVPVRHKGGQVRYVLTAVIPTGALQKLVTRYTTAPGESRARSAIRPAPSAPAR